MNCDESLPTTLCAICNVAIDSSVDAIQSHLDAVHDNVGVAAYFEKFVRKNDLDDVSSAEHFEENFDCFRFNLLGIILVTFKPNSYYSLFAFGPVELILLLRNCSPLSLTLQHRSSQISNLIVKHW